MKRKIWFWGLSFVFLLTLLIAPVQQSFSASEGASNADSITGSALGGQYHLSHVVKIYVPSTVKGSIPITDEAHEKFVDQALTKFSNWFGGATAVAGSGAWVDNDKKLIKEKVTIVYAFAEKLDKEAVNQVVSFAKQMKGDLEQSSIALEVDGKMYFIE
ncbi:DUF3574 domain-containing protein [Paenibacillus allorhizosphaerae]|uniref:DUF3574 domain-containing protein n=1 Tax=Paenibacillus allorhizosphaerae TaxID=2849866 RepID=A0ABM8VQI5_9BACL|nr:DUF3574 domain-containing protein [Paenibacillus allorhizosphaerae]CAG7654250.1 hypothetical protein PAECIP111802_05715 [Paenibacillus allorhizosphaerae]